MPYRTWELDFDSGYWREAVWVSLPAVSGIYCVYAGTRNTAANTVFLRRLLYIGESGNVRTRAPAEPKNRRDRWEKKLQPGELMYASCATIGPESVRKRVEAALIFHHNPPCNYEYTESFPFDRTTIHTTGKSKYLRTSFTVEQ